MFAKFFLALAHGNIELCDITYLGNVLKSATLQLFGLNK